MSARVPRSRKPPAQLRRRNAPEQWVALPAEGCKLPVPEWPIGAPSPEEAALWKRLWALPVACWWADQKIEPTVVARYVSLAIAKPALAVVARLESDLGLTPAGMLRMRLVVEYPEPEAVPTADPYRHLREAL